MKVYELISKYDVDTIVNAVIDEYPDQLRNYFGYDFAVRQLQVMEVIDSEHTVVIEHVDPHYEDDEPYENVSTRLPNDDTRWAMDFTPWSEVLGMNIDPDIFNRYTEQAVIGHILYEMTFNGYSNEETQAKAEELFGIVDDFKKEYNIE